MLKHVMQSQPVVYSKVDVDIIKGKSRIQKIYLLNKNVSVLAPNDCILLEKYLLWEKTSKERLNKKGTPIVFKRLLEELSH